MRRRDTLFAAGCFIALAIENSTVREQRGPLALNLLVIAAMTVPAIWRRRHPLGYTVAVLAAATVLLSALTGDGTNLAPIYVLTVPAYTVARERPLLPAVLGLVLVVGWATAVNAAGGSAAGDYLGTAVTCAVAWGLGRALRAWRTLAAELDRKTRRIDAERESRARLAVADERTRIARELHTVIASRVSAMVVQAEAAELLLDDDPARADEAMAAVEQTGREALSDMRRMLGVLRHAGEAPELAPQPGVGQLHALVERARADWGGIELRVDGEPGPLPASVDLGLYRILEDALATAAVAGGEALIELRFGESDVELVAAVSGASAPPPWPTLAMRERVAVCGGAIRTETGDGGGRLVTRLPRAFEAVFA
ncbi:MAG TPA: histidine kinase [Thermoleophilaceae bacterium]|nr:histidine kinase [Thermoleophilaceae bacterium]